jgi:hypothetical protein
MYDKYKAVLFIEKYHLKIEKDLDKDRYLASQFNYPYLDAKILYSEKYLNDWQKNKLDAERRLIHEFTHIVTDQFYSVVINWPTKQAIEDARERLTDHIAQIINKHYTQNSK